MSPQGHCLSDSELCGAIANKRMYEIRKRSVFSKQSGYSFASRQYRFYRAQIPSPASVLILLSFFCFSHFLHQLRQLAVFSCYVAVILCFVR